VSDTLAQLSHPQFWVAVVQIIWADLVLSGDNAVVIAMACRRLPPRERRWGMIIGAGAAAVLLIVFTITVSALIALPYLRMVGACALIVIAVNLLGPGEADQTDAPRMADSLWRAVRTVVLADVIMGLDNAVAVAAIANGRYLLLGLGLAISIPIVVAGSAVILGLIERFPIIVWVGGAMLGLVAGELFASDPVVGAALQSTGLATWGANSALAPGIQRLADQVGVAPAQLVFGLSAAVIVLLAGAAWRRLKVRDRDAAC
jgi:YjbE family integral membrane protein